MCSILFPIFISFVLLLWVHFVAMDVKMLTCLEQIKAQVHQNTKLLQALLKKSYEIQSVEEGESNQFNIFPL